jgi:hypothetical protein
MCGQESSTGRGADPALEAPHDREGHSNHRPDLIGWGCVVVAALGAGATDR